MTARQIAVYALLPIAALLILPFVLAPFPAHAQNFRAADQVYLLGAIHITSPWSTYASDVWITNESNDPVSVNVTYSPHNGPPVPVVKRDVIHLAPHELREICDFLGPVRESSKQCKFTGLMGIASGFGQLVFSSCLDGADCRWDQVNSDGMYDPPPSVTRNYRNISVESRIYSYAPTGGPSAQTVGQDLPGVPWWSFGNAANPLKITGIRSSDTAHTNLAFVNASDTQPVTLTVTLYDGASHSQRDQAQVRLAPFESRQQGATELFPLLGEWNRLNRTRAATNAYVTVACIETNGVFFAYGSLIDSRSGDATTLEATFSRALNEGQIAVLFGAPFNTTPQELRDWCAEITASGVAPQALQVQVLSAPVIHQRLEKE